MGYIKGKLVRGPTCDLLISPDKLTRKTDYIGEAWNDLSPLQTIEQAFLSVQKRTDIITQ